MVTSKIVGTCQFSVLTACLPERSVYLNEAAASVARARELVSPNELEWIIAVDGPGDLPDVTAQARVVRIERRSGISAARNAALAFARGDLIAPLDADDTLVADGLLEAQEALLNDHLGWIACNRVLLSTQGKTGHWHGRRTWQPGGLAESWSAPFAFHPNSIVVRRDLILRCGGWPALATNEDLFLAMLLSERAAGLSIEAVLTRYRVWDGQEVSSPSYPATKRIAFRFIEASLNSIRREFDRDPVTHPRPGGAYGKRATGTR
ncbi:glycosyltransferase [Nakamurella antarctica]|uniref:Glycosyltransferase n=1 Tax=Nakamurella antarctica TaxID=1902245 RepID=A0A3G8ZIY9_9ACTN|nr:glycosyltransferase [Nakamurella antarctica]